MLSAEKFPKRIAFLKSPACRRVRTNHHGERINRQLGYEEKARYKWRKRRTLVRFVVLLRDRPLRVERRAKHGGCHVRAEQPVEYHLPIVGGGRSEDDLPATEQRWITHRDPLTPRIIVPPAEPPGLEKADMLIPFEDVSKRSKVGGCTVRMNRQSLRHTDLRPCWNRALFDG